MIGFGQYEELTPAFAKFFSRTLEHTLIRGMRRDYVVMEESLVAVRGRLCLERQMRSPVLTPPTAGSTSTSATPRTTASSKQQRTDCWGSQAWGEQNRDALRHLFMWFGEVGDHPPPPRAVLRRGFTRLDTYYEPAVRLAKVRTRCLTGIRGRNGGAVKPIRYVLASRSPAVLSAVTGVA